MFHSIGVFRIISLHLVLFLAACGGGGAGSVSGINSGNGTSWEPTIGQVISYNGQSFTITNVSSDYSFVDVSSPLMAFQGGPTATLRFTKYADNRYKFENTVIIIWLDTETAGVQWSFKNSYTSSVDILKSVASNTSVTISSEVFSQFDSSGGKATYFVPERGLTGNFYTLLRSNPTTGDAHFNFKASGVSENSIKIKSTSGSQEFILTYNPTSGFYENVISSGAFSGYSLYYDVMNNNFWYSAPVLVSPNFVGDTSGLVRYYGYDAVIKEYAADSTIDTSNLKIIDPIANFSMGSISVNNISGQKDIFESLLETYKLNIENYGFTWTAATDPDLSYGKINITGLPQAHLDGWSGLGASIRIVDDYPNGIDLSKLDSFGQVIFTHGANTYAISRAVAPEATFRRDQYLGPDNNWLASDSTIDVVNVSLGSHITDYASLNSGLIAASSFITTSLSQIATASPSAVIVESAGNNGAVNGVSTSYGCLVKGSRNTADSCTDIKYAVDGNYYSSLDRTIFVGSYDNATNDISYYSVSAGPSAKNHFILADGNSLLDGGIGTSYAAPRVTGAIALVSQKFPNLTAAQKKKLILHTATDLGDAGIDDTYGHGMLNITAALSPIGQLH